ncbi:hypothetical protein TDB9533_00491 [Thalassocella blandensis]|nr:hypothetical protein TDB9533_00491 [Thalassocella blandensis]
MKPSLTETKKQFIDVIEDRYALAQNHRGKEFATFNHFESTFFDQLDDQEKTKVVKDAFLALDVKSLSRYFWLVSVYKLRLWQFSFDFLTLEKNSFKKKAC